MSGERRHLTVLFCDLVGSTEIASRLDPEEWRDIVASYHRAAAEAVERFGGHVAKYLGDGVMAFFGYPEAHENDAERAARAGLAVLDAVAKLDSRVKLTARVGIDSGSVVVGAGASKDADVFGDTPNIAARVQAAAGPGTLLITPDTHRLISGLFVVEERGEHALRGVESSLRLFRVVRPSGMRGRLEAAAARGLTPFVGREDELRLLTNRWERVREGEGQVVTIIGEAGIGKSRLVQQFREQIAAVPHTWLECVTAAFSQNTPFYAVTEMMRQSFRWDTSHSDDRRLAALEASLALAGVKLNEAVPLIASLLELPVGAKYSTPSMTPAHQRRQLLATLVEWVFGAARVQPLVIATEDLHWADPSTLELTRLLVEQGATAPLMLIYTARPEFRSQWSLRAHHTQIALNRLSSRNVRTMIGEVAARKALSDDTIAAVVERTGGVPLFVEELTHAVLEGGISVTGRSIPATLHDSLMARLDRLGPAKEVIQVGAVIGVEFSYELLHAVHPIAEHDFEQALRTASDAELLYVRGIPPHATYQFKHALIRDTAYGALLKSRRKELHRRIAQAIADKYPSLAHSQSEVLARHWTDAGEPELAIRAWQTAADQALRTSANPEAISYIANALNALRDLSDTPERAQQELTLRVMMAAPLMASRGYGAPEVEDTFARATELCRRVNESPQLFLVLRGLHRFYLVRGKHDKAREFAEQCLTLAQNVEDPNQLMEAHLASGESAFYMGRLTSAQLHLTEALNLYKTDKHRPSPARNVQDPAVASQSHLAMATQLLGFPERAANMCRAALSHARELSHPFSLAYALNGAALLYQLRHDIEQTRSYAEAALIASRQGEFSLFTAEATVLLGWALTQQGRTEEGMVRIRDGLAAWRATGAELLIPLFLGLLADAHLNQDSIEDASRLMAEAITTAQRSSEQVCRSELHRMSGKIELLNRPCDAATSQRFFREAMDWANQQEAGLWKLRTATSLARLLASQGRRDEARTMLADTYNWFTEGFDTADLKDARALLDELNA